MSSALYQFITKRFEKDKLTAEGAGVRIQFSDGSLILEGPKSALSEFYESCIRPLEDGSIPITGDQWNMLVTAKEDGTLFQNIVKPYQHNPNVLIDKKEDPFTLVIVGYKDTVRSARESFLCKLGKKTNTMATSRQNVDTGFNSDDIQPYTPLRSEGHLSDTKEQSAAFSTDSICDSQNVKVEPLLWTLITSRHMSTLEAEDCKVSYSKESPGVFEVLGKKEVVQSVVTKIAGIEADLKSKLCCETVEVDKSFQFSLNEQSILSFVKSVEEKCFVKIDLPRSNTVLSKATGPTSNPQIILSGDKAGSSDVPDAVYQWEFMDDDRKFQPFEQKLSSQVENKYLMNPKPCFSFSHGKWSYSVNLDTMTQTNKETGKTRTIKRSMYIPSWYWEDDDGTYHPYSQAVSVMIDQIQNGTIKNQVDIDGRCYMFDFSAKHQVDISTGHKRKIKPRTRTLTIHVNGCIEDVCVAKKKITEFFKNIEKEDKFPFPLEFSSKMKPLIANLCARHSVKISFQDSSESISVILHGWEKAVVLVKEQCMKELFDLMSGRIKITVKHPDEWEPDDNPFVMKNVSRNSQEFQKVLTRMQETMPDVTIKKLERVQNQWLWEKYAHHRTRIHRKNHGKIKEKDLFHGTSETDPSLIYNGEEGFDMRFCTKGMWGLGNYFAVNASYSHHYAHRVSGEKRQMFLTRVITGESCPCESNSSLRMPPTKPSARHFAGERYDSVTGTTRGSQVFIIYDNVKAYPLYLITYQCQTQLKII